jgi:tetratricopeptide (TPR) repeat protein
MLLAGGAFAMWQNMRTIPLTDRDVLVLADFTNSTGDPVFDSTLREALAFQLEQSPFLKVLDDDVVRQDLQLMRRSPAERFTNGLAHDVCVREAEKAMLAGSIASLGKSYILELKATNCQTKATLAREQTEAVDKEHVLQALAKAAQSMRAKLGESLSSIQKLAPPDSRVTTSSLEAFQAYAAGQRLFLETRFVESIPLLRRATELDPNFAAAWTSLASASLNTGAGANMARVQEYADRAWALRDQVSESERLRLTGSHYMAAIGDFGKATEAFELMKQTYPRDPAPLVQLALILNREGDFEGALRNELEAVQLAPRRPLYASLVMDDYIRLDQFAEAKAVAQKHFEQGFDNPQVHQLLLRTAWIEDDQNGAMKQIQWFAGKPEEHIAMEDQAAHARMLGQLGRSRELLERAASLARRRNLPDVAARLLAPNANGDALLGDCTPARRTSANQPITLAICGDAAMLERAQKKAEELSRSEPDNTLSNGVRIPLLRAAVEFGR